MVVFSTVLLTYHKNIFQHLIVYTCHTKDNGREQTCKIRIQLLHSVSHSCEKNMHWQHPSLCDVNNIVTILFATISLLNVRRLKNVIKLVTNQTIK